MQFDATNPANLLEVRLWTDSVFHWFVGLEIDDGVWNHAVFSKNRDRLLNQDLVDQLFNSSEKRLARVLLMLAHLGKEGIPESVVPKISQETLAEMVGTTRSRVSFS